MTLTLKLNGSVSVLNRSTRAGIFSLCLRLGSRNEVLSMISGKRSIKDNEIVLHTITLFPLLLLILFQLGENALCNP